MKAGALSLGDVFRATIDEQEALWVVRWPVRDGCTYINARALADAPSSRFRRAIAAGELHGIHVGVEVELAACGIPSACYAAWQAEQWQYRYRMSRRGG